MAKRISEQDIFNGDIFANARKSAGEYLKMLEALQGELKEMLAINKKILEASSKDLKNTEQLKKRAGAIKQVSDASKNLEIVDRERIKTEREMSKLQADNERLRQAKLRSTVQERKEEERLAKIKAKNLKLAKQEGQAYSKMSKKLNELRNRYKNLAAQNKQNTKEGRKLLSTIQQLDGRLKKIDKSVGQSQRNVGNYTSAWGKLGARLKSVASAFGLMGGVFGAVQLIKGSFNVIADFDTAIGNLGAISNATGPEMDQLKNKALELGEVTKFTATEIAGLEVELAKLGFKTPEILASTESILALASATGSELADASFLAGSTLRAFNMDASEMERVASVLGVSTTKSALNMEFLQTAMSKVAPVANAMGFSIEDTTALLGTLSNAGFDASSSATATRNILLKLADANGELAQTLGAPVRSLDELAPALAELEKRGIDVGEALEVTDKRSVSAFLTMVNGTDTMLELREGLVGVSDELQAMSDKQLDTINGKFALLNSKWQGLILGASQSTGAVQKIKDAIQFLTDNLELILSVIYNVIKGLIIFKTTQFAVNTALKVGRLLSIAYRISMVAMSRGIGSATKMMKIFNTTMKSNPIGLLIGGLTTAIALLWDFGDAGEENVDKVKEKVDELAVAYDKMKEKNKEVSEQIETDSKKRVASLKVELAQLKANGASEQELAEKQHEIEKETLNVHLHKKAVEFKTYQELSKLQRDKQKELDTEREWLIEHIQGYEEYDMKTRKVIPNSKKLFKDMSDTEIAQNNEKFRILLQTTKQYGLQRKEQDKILQKLVDEEMIIRDNLEASKLNNKVEGEKAKTVAFYKTLITDVNKKLQTQITTRKEAIPLQKQIRDYEKEIDKILGKKGGKGKSYNNILKQQVAFETELLRLQRERLALIADQDQELLEFQIDNVNEWIDAEIKLRQEQAKSKEFIEQGNRVMMTELQNLLDLRFEMEKELLEKQLLEEQTKANQSNADYIKNVNKRLKDGKLSQDQADALIEASRKKLIEKLALLEQEHLHDVSEKNDERVVDFKETDQEIADLTSATIDSLYKDGETTKKIEKDVLKQRLTAFREFTTEIIRQMDRRTDAQIAAIDEEISVSKKREDELRQLAIQGTTTAEQSLAAEQKRQAELERQKQELEKKKMRRQAILSGLDLLSNKLDNNEGDAVASTIRDITKLVAIIGNLPAFAEGSEYVHQSNAPKGKDQILARIDEGERIMTREQNKKLGGISNEQLTAIGSDFNNGVFEDVNYIKPQMKKLNEPFQSSNMILTKFDELQKTIENKPMLTEVRWDEVTNMIIERVESKNKINNKHHSTKGIF
tara:strand:- start:5190 stop:9137 length:3948 start_codon:yes stop_codon:yes gene_type:complete